MKLAFSVSVTALALGMSTMGAAATISNVKDGLTDFEQMEYDAPAPGDFTAGTAPTPLLAASIGTQRQLATFTPTNIVRKSFEGITQYDVASYARNFIPPDTMGAVGTTQYASFANGGFAVFEKDGTVRTAESDLAFWAAAGQTGANGDSRVMFDAAAKRWVALSFGANVSDIQIAVSKTANAAGAWQSTKFTGYAGGTADYPTLAMDSKAVYIGTNDFNGNGSFGGTTLNIIPLSSLVSAAAPTTAGIKSFFTACNATACGDAGYAIQGVNNQAVSTTGKVVADSLFYTNVLSYNINNTGTAGASRSNFVYAQNASYDQNNPARQPNVVPDQPTPGSAFTSNDRVVDTLDDRIGSSVYQVGNLIYSVRTVTPTGTDFTAVRYYVTNATTGALVSEGDISDGAHDYWEGSLAVNQKGEVVIGYNRSGSNPADGNISFFARIFSTDNTGHLVQQGAEQLLKVSLVDDYHNCSLPSGSCPGDGYVAAGRQRWGDYSAVSLDPANSNDFWVTGEFAREYNDPAGGHPTGTGGSRWSTWIAEINTGNNVPEPASWMMMIAGFGLIGTMARRRSGYAAA